MDKKIFPVRLRGTVRIPSSKSLNHRAVIGAALAEEPSVLQGIFLSEDILATLGAMRRLGAAFAIDDQPVDGESRSWLGREVTLMVTPIPAQAFTERSEEIVTLDCGESGSTLRFLVPIVALFPKQFRLLGRGKLLSRPMTPFEPILQACGIDFAVRETGVVVDARDGQLKAGAYALPGNVSSQFLTGLLLALPLVDGDSTLTVTSPLESVGYIDLTLSTLAAMGVHVVHEAYQQYRIAGGQRYKGRSLEMEGDYSQGAFFLVARYLGHDLQIEGLRADSLQGDKEIESFLAQLTLANNAQREIDRTGEPLVFDGSQCPDIIPVLTLAACFTKRPVRIVNVGRLRIKESDRLTATVKELKALGARLEEKATEIYIEPVMSLFGDATVSAHNDHRMAMMLAIAGSICEKPITITGAESVAKSFPTFWDVYAAIGGKTA